MRITNNNNTEHETANSHAGANNYGSIVLDEECAGGAGCEKESDQFSVHTQRTASLSPLNSFASDTTGDQNQESIKLLPLDSSSKPYWKQCDLSINRLCLIIGANVLLFLIYFIPHQRHNPSHSLFPPPLPRHHVQPEMFFTDQILDHVRTELSDSDTRWSQRYYEERSYFGGPGHPIFVVMGGESPMDAGIPFPFISEQLGKLFSAYTIVIEHRFYGKSFPVMNYTASDLRRLLAPDQALFDAVRIIRAKQDELGCGPKGTDTYCPVMTVGGSYPGFLSAMMRIVHPDTVDIGYASSAPLHAFIHPPEISRGAYFEKVTSVAETASPGCAADVKSSLLFVQDTLTRQDELGTFDIELVAQELGVCDKTFPSYITTGQLLSQEINMIVAEKFAENNMDYYPPSPNQQLVQGCHIFQDKRLTSWQKLDKFLNMREPEKLCFDLVQELPPGPAGTISASDWSGVGGGLDGLMWDYQSCTLVLSNSFSEKSMLPAREFTMEWLTNHCETRFGYTPNPSALVDEFHFDNLSGVKRLLFTNGMNDGWIVWSLVTPPSEAEDVRVINISTGSHHSDLSPTGPSYQDTNDMIHARHEASNVIAEWLAQIRNEQKAHQRRHWGSH